jgi:enoyl-CoA hydratase/carnithine racemase
VPPRPAGREGIFPGLATVRLPRLIGLGAARNLILSGELIEAGEALRLELVGHLVPAEQFEAGTAEVLQSYLQVPATAAAASKHLMRRAFEAPLATLTTEMLPLLAECLASADVQAAAGA